MNASELRQRLKPWMLPAAMLCGFLFHSHISVVAFLTPYLIFVMLFITFCRIDPREFRLSPMLGWLLLVQVAGALLLYAAILPLSPDVAQAVFICVFCPTATAAPVVTGMLGGSVTRLVTYSFISNVTVAALAPAILAAIGTDGVEITATALSIMAQVGPLIFLPLAAALIMRHVTPRLHKAVGSHQALSFYIWAISLFIVVGRSVSFIMAEPPSRAPEIIIMALAAGAVCILQFWIGRRVGRRYGDPVSGAQGLGQKNTVLAIWIALTYLNPIASVGPAAYIAWQNTINSVQLYYRTSRHRDK